MAKLIPPVNIDEIQVPSEREVARMLVEALPADCTVYHSFPWLRLNRHQSRADNSVLQEGEIDFLILWPQRGMLVLEVKGGAIRDHAKSMTWYSLSSNGKE